MLTTIFQTIKNEAEKAKGRSMKMTEVVTCTRKISRYLIFNAVKRFYNEGTGINQT